VSACDHPDENDERGRQSAFDSNDKQYPPRQAAAAWKQLAYVHQQEGEILVQYYNHFAKVVEHVERLYRTIAPSVVAEKDKTGKRTDEVKASKGSKRANVSGPAHGRHQQGI
jgi:hypothetical protein